MRRVGGLLLVVMVACAGLLGAAGAGAAEPPEYGGDFNFPTIRDLSYPEEYGWRVELGEDQVLRQVDARTAEVRYAEEGFTAFTIVAGAAHDAQGADVPTTLAVAGPATLILTVHHRAGNPAAGGAPFEYPVLGGTGWEGGFRTIVVPLGESPPATPEPVPAETAPTTIAAPSEPEPVLVTRALGEDKLYLRPHSFLLSADDTFGVAKIQWKSYGGAVAKASGRAFVNDCIPNCAAGRFSHPQARLRLAKIVSCQGRSVYSRLHYALTGPLPQGFPRQGGLAMLPLGEDGKPDC